MSAMFGDGMRIELHDSGDWCHICGVRNNSVTLDVFYPNGGGGCDYLRICNVCVARLSSFVENPSGFLSSVYERIVYARKKAGFSQKSFAMKLDMSPGNWSKIENGMLGVKCELIEKINKILKLDIRYYFGLLNYMSAVEGEAK